MWNFPAVSKIALVCISLAAIAFDITHKNFFNNEPKLSPVIQTDKGMVQGAVGYSASGKEIWKFLGIPFAEPPVGHRKFFKPTPNRPWDGIKSVVEYTPECPQIAVLFDLKVSGSLDCLYLNVFTRSYPRNQSELKPVIIFIYGGGYTSGSAKMFQPDFFMDQDIVFVNFNYRLGPYGFLNLGEPNGPTGNMALFDQLLVLQWVQKNIVNFGGDPTRVSLMGNSAGAAMVQAHLLSPLSQGLFSRAIITSGSLLAPWAFSRDPKHVATKYAEKLGCNTDNLLAIRQCFDETPWKKLIGNQRTLVDPLVYTDAFVPSVDGQFLNDSPINLLNSGRFPNIPILFGVNSAEGILGPGKFQGRPHLILELQQDWANKLSNLAKLERPFDEDIAFKIKEQYFGTEKNFAKDEQTFIEKLILLASDAGFWNPVHKSATIHAKSGAPTVLYYFDYISKIFPGTYSIFRSVTSHDQISPKIKLVLTVGLDWVKEFVFGNPVTHKYGAGHADETLILWNFEGFTKFLANPDEGFRTKMIQAIVDFASGVGTLKFNGVDWPKVDKSGENLPYVVLDDTDVFKVVKDPVGSRRQFWVDLETYLLQTNRSIHLY